MGGRALHIIPAVEVQYVPTIPVDKNVSMYKQNYALLNFTYMTIIAQNIESE